jgi:hypothetical protein
MMDRSIQSSIIGEDPIRRPTFGNFDRVVPHLYWMTMNYLPLAIFLQFNLKYVVVFADVHIDPRTYVFERKEEGPLKLALD